MGGEIPCGTGITIGLNPVRGFSRCIGGWQYFGGLTLGGAWLYDSEMGWLWDKRKYLSVDVEKFQ